MSSELRTHLAQLKASHLAEGHLSQVDAAFLLEASLSLMNECEELEAAEELRDRDVTYWSIEVQRLTERCQGLQVSCWLRVI